MAARDNFFSHRISVYHDEEWKNVRKRLRHFDKNANEEIIHKLRVGIKKITALYELIGYCDKDFDGKKSLKPLTRIFKLLGKLRDHSNALSLCLGFKIDISVLDHDHHKLKGTHTKIMALAEKHKSDFRKIKRSASRHLHHTKTDRWKKYLHEKHLEVTNSLADRPTAEQLHKTRADIKKLIYNAGLYHTEVINKAEIERLDKTEKFINQWHDVCVFRDKLDEINYKMSAPKIYAAIKRKEQQLRPIK